MEQTPTCFFSTLTAGGRLNSGAFSAYSRASSLTLAKTCNRYACIQNICQHGVSFTAAGSVAEHVGMALLHTVHSQQIYRFSHQQKAEFQVFPNLLAATSYLFPWDRMPGIRRTLRFCGSLFPFSRLRRSEGRRRDIHLPDVASKTNVEKVEH